MSTADDPDETAEPHPLDVRQACRHEEGPVHFRIYDMKNLVTGEFSLLWINKDDNIMVQTRSSFSKWHGWWL